MSDIQDKVRARAKELLESGEVHTFIGWEAGRFANQTTPLIITDASQADRLVYNEYCANTLAKYVKDVKADGKVALCVRGCDSRAVNRMISDEVFTRDDVLLLGMPCTGMKDRKTDEMLAKCKECRHKNPVVFDEMMDEAASEEAPAIGRFDDVKHVEEMERTERNEYFERIFRKCIRCYACRDVCPCCTCRECFVDQHREGWLGKQNNLNENRFYQLTRVMHIADRCIECGECERVCPMDLPLMEFNRKAIMDMNDLFGEFEAGMTDDEPKAALLTYQLDDVEEFM